MKTKTLFLSSILFIFFTLQSQAQNTTSSNFKTFEIGASYSSNGIGLDLKRHVKNNTFIRLSNIHLGAGGNIQNDALRLSFGLNLGIENRFLLSDKWWISHGPEAGFSGKTASITDRSNNIWGMSLGYFVGINYNISERIYLGLELKPQFYLGHASSSNGTNIPFESTNYGLQSNGKINLSYRF